MLELTTVGTPTELKTLIVEDGDNAGFYYCKSFRNDGLTLVVFWTDNDGKKHAVRTTEIDGNLSFNIKDNSTFGPAKRSGAKCPMKIKSGTIIFKGPVLDVTEYFDKKKSKKASS